MLRMFRSRLIKLLIIALIIADVVLIRFKLLRGNASAGPPQAMDVMARVQSQIGVVDLTEQERLWDKPSWLFDYQQALRVASRTHRPIFLYAMHGRLDSRC